MKNYLKVGVILTGLFLILAAPLCRTGVAQDKKVEKKKGIAPPLAPVVVPPVKLPDPAVAVIKAELDQIIKIHDVLEKQQRADVQEIQRIADQAKIHQKLLQQLDLIKRTEAARQRVGVDEVLRIEKIRQIQKTTEVNKAYLEKIREEEEAAQKRAEFSGGRSEPRASVPTSEKEEPRKKVWWQ